LFKAYLLTGTNMGEREENLSRALALLEKECGHIEKASSLYETAAWGKTDQPSFINQALLLVTLLNAKQLMRRILKIERAMGRERMEKYGPRIIDIDILLFDDEICNYPFLVLPHPELQNRRFALVPLAEIAPAVIHPRFQKTVTELLEECKDDLGVKKYS
jgi:2-amino-4-hydroxy-6-hydroxymethyldihydropteridine diphosphokinase